MARYDFDNDPEFANLTPEQKEAKKKKMFAPIVKDNLIRLENRKKTWGKK